MAVTQGAKARRLSAFFTALGGLRGRFFFPDPSIEVPVAAGNPYVTEAQVAGATTLRTAGWGLGLRAGDFFQLDSDVTTRLYQLTADVTPIGIGHSTDHAFVVGPAVPESVKNIKDFVEWAKANPGKASIGNPAAGSMPHLLAGRLAMLGGFQITNVPFAGSGPAIPQVMGGQLAGMSSPLGDWVQHHKGGKIRILATSGPDRAVFTPDVATYREQGFGELQVREWFGFFAPAGVSDAVKQNLNAALRQAMGQQDIRDFVTPLAANLEASTTAEHTRRLADDSEMARRLVTALAFKADS